MDNEKRLVLAHEEGHIYCDHLSSVPILGRDVIEEHEANEFTHYILSQSPVNKISTFLKEKWKAVCIVAAVAIVFIIGISIFHSGQKKENYYKEYYLTSTGNKYHRIECIFVKDKDNVHRMTNGEFESGEYSPCGICLPNGKME